ncbi:MAG: hypothetical protein LBJ96_01055 [Holosporaceae bacterium]|jgi:hypothetical protein|nr:hypothetical protein [Holosporaceae bacterium]
MRVFALSLFLLFISGCGEHKNATTTKATSQNQQQKATFQKLLSEVIDAVSKDDIRNCSGKIWKIYEQELFAGIGFCGNKPLHTLLEINAAFLSIFQEMRKRYDFCFKKYEYENAEQDYAKMKESLIRDLKKLFERDMGDRYVAMDFLEKNYVLHLCNFMNKNRSILTDAWYGYIHSATDDVDRVPAGLNEAVVSSGHFHKYSNFPDTELQVMVFSLKNSKCKVVAFIHGCCDASVRQMYLFNPKKGRQPENISIDVKSPWEDGNVRDIHVGHDDLRWNKDNFTFSVGEGEYERKYLLDLKDRTVRSIVKK